ncbi:SAM-dependent methyltransferase, partial [Pseudomonas sp. MOB-449]|nr:SAM-dependent methyltransferase [Pseudomonas sp. MOB-449]
MKQKEINALLVEKALNGLTVVRLKGGDPSVFGRVGEEADALHEHGIRYEMVPGITSGIAAPLYAGIPVTHRDFASSFAMITAHDKS